MEYTGCGFSEHRDLKARVEYCPDCHLFKISLRKGSGANVLHFDGSLKGLAIPRI
jgi:prepilin-type processing-associated H-X9-DG protein